MRIHFARVVMSLALMLASSSVRGESEAVAKPPVEVTFAYATDWAARASAIHPSVSVLQFVFDLKSDCAMAGNLEISNAKVSVAGKALEVGMWQGIAYDGSDEFDPERTPPPAPPDKWSMIITALGDFGKVDPGSCEFSADIVVTCGKSPKEVSTMMPLPKGKSTAENPTGHIELKEVEPFDIRIVKKSYPSLTRIGDSVTGYYLAVMPELETFGWGHVALWATFSEAFVANGKEYSRCLSKREATDPVRVVVKYWSEIYKVPVHLSKAASNKGRTPPRKGAVDGVPREGKGG